MGLSLPVLAIIGPLVRNTLRGAARIFDTRQNGGVSASPCRRFSHAFRFVCLADYRR